MLAMMSDENYAKEINRAEDIVVKAPQGAPSPFP